MYRVLTIAREFGSGGALVAGRAAERLGWKLLDSALIDAIATAARVDPELARRFDERVDSWVHRVSRRSLWHGGLESVATVDDSSCFDAEAMTSLAVGLIREAHRQGECVIVGRGAQCILQQSRDAFHAFVYAPMRDKLARVRERLPNVRDPKALIASTEERRSEFVRSNFGCRWNDPHLYHVMICSSLGIETAVDTIFAAMRAGGDRA